MKLDDEEDELETPMLGKKTFSETPALGKKAFFENPAVSILEKVKDIQNTVVLDSIPKYKWPVNEMAKMKVKSRKEQRSKFRTKVLITFKKTIEERDALKKSIMNLVSVRTLDILRFGKKLASD